MNENFKVEHEIGTGGFAAVYHGIDVRLGRPVAIKIVRASSELISNALDHARALARTKHPNVATVYGIASVDDPITGKSCDAVIMELIHGPTLEDRLKGPPFTRDEVRAIGTGLTDGLAHIHAQGLTHEDLHEANVLIEEGNVKIIDIMHRTTLKDLSTAPKRVRVRRDLANLRDLLHSVLAHSEVDRTATDAFVAFAVRATSIESIRTAFHAATEPSTSVTATPDMSVAESTAVTTDAPFLPDAQYRAILNETADRLQFAHWDSRMSGLTTNDQPSLAKETIEHIDDFTLWLLRRPWPGTRDDLEIAFKNLRRVAGDLLRIFKSRIADPNAEMLWTKSHEYDYQDEDDPENRELQEAYDAHVDLIQDLTAEVTRAANWLCELARKAVDPSFFLDHGWLTLTSGPHDLLQYETFIVRYTKEDLAIDGPPYKGLTDFISRRKLRDRHWGDDQLPKRLRYLAFPDIHKKSEDGLAG
jgi:tRNA A-37 threonylcarbamoyl transferase component Bud32